MIGAGLPLIVVSRQLGHANPHINITATIYAHLLGDHQLDLAAEAFDDSSVVETVRGTIEDAWKPSLYRENVIHSSPLSKRQVRGWSPLSGLVKCLVSTILSAQPSSGLNVEFLRLGTMGEVALPVVPEVHRG